MGWAFSSFAAAVVLSIATSSCSQDVDTPHPSPDPARDPGKTEVTSLIGEIHLHQFALGSHGWAAFLTTPVPRDQVKSDQLIDLQPAPTAIEGPCTLFVQPSCTPLCGAGTLCLAPDTCTPYSAVRYQDAGEVRVEGSTVVSDIRMWFAGATAPYDIDPPAGRTLLFNGGDSLHVYELDGDLAFDGQVTGPKPIVLRKPSFDSDLHFSTGDLDLQWDTENSLQVVALITASSRVDGSGATIRCATADTGALVVPASMMSVLPKAPRDIRLELERNDERVFPTKRPGVGVIVHAAQSTWKNGLEL